MSPIWCSTGRRHRTSSNRPMGVANPLPPSNNRPVPCGWASQWSRPSARTSRVHNSPMSTRSSSPGQPPAAISRATSGATTEPSRRRRPRGGSEARIRAARWSATNTTGELPRSIAATSALCQRRSRRASEQRWRGLGPVPHRVEPGLVARDGDRGQHPRGRDLTTPNRAYGVATAALAAIGLIDLVATVFLRTEPAPQPVARPPRELDGDIAMA
jgi:hypothetical protein